MKAKLSPYLSGDKKFQRKARVIFPILVRQAKAGEKITYSDLAKEAGYSNSRNLNYPLGAIGETIGHISNVWKEDIPVIQSLVVSKTLGVPSHGISGFFTKKDYNTLNLRQKKMYIEQELLAVFSYQKWDDLLLESGLSPEKNKISNFTEQARHHGKNKGGEGEEHRALKLYIKEHPKSVDYHKVCTSYDEYALPSGDSIDVFFENKREWVGIEVKSRISTKLDIIRGIYQVIKYQAVLDALAKATNPYVNVTTILVVEKKISKTALKLANTLGVTVISDFKRLP